MADKPSTDEQRLQQFRSRLNLVPAAAPAPAPAPAESPTEPEPQATKPPSAKPKKRTPKKKGPRPVPKIEAEPTPVSEPVGEVANKGLLFTVTESTVAALDDFVATKHRAGEYGVRRQTILVGTLEAYIDQGMALAVDEPTPGQSKKRIPVRVTPALHQRYMETFKDFGRRKSTVFERALLTYLRNGLSAKG